MLTDITGALTLISPELKPADTAFDRFVNYACVAAAGVFAGALGSLIK